MNEYTLCCHCGKEFEVLLAELKRGKGKYCSKQCSYDSQRTLLPRNCETCGSVYKPASDASKYCSRVCYYKGKRTLIEKQCAACGKGISVQRSKVYDNNFCSNECFHNFQKTGKYIDCDNCGKRIYKSPAFLRNSRNFCSQKCFGMGSRSKNYETNKTGRRGTNWNKQRTKAQLRDNKTCQICGYHQHKRMKRRYIDVHHIIPFRHFGGNWKEANVLSNLICLCRDCHVKVEAGEIPCPRPLF